MGHSALSESSGKVWGRIISDKAENHSKSRVSNIFTIAPSQAFLNVLVDAIMDGRLIDGFSPKDDPLALSTATIFVPSRRAARALSTAFLERLQDKGAVILPNFRTLGDVSDEEFGLDLEVGEFGQLAESIDPLSRQLELASLVHKWVDQIDHQTLQLYGDEEIRIPSSRADALKLADDLCALLSQIAQEEVDWSAILKLVSDHQSNWWQLTTTFLKIIAEFWPQHLEEQALIDPAERTARLLDLRASRYENEGSKGPVIIAGSTGSVPSTQRLLKAVSKLANGAVVMPGLDQSIPQEEWQRLSTANPSDDPAIETHPQFGLARLLRNLDVPRESVMALSSKAKDIKDDCRKLISMALTPADFTSNWLNQTKPLAADDIKAMLSHVSLIDAGNERSEALAVAIAMREVLETEGKTAALVTPDRNLAQRVSTELRRFNINVDDTGGTPLSNSSPAIFLRLIIEAAFGKSRNNTLASLLKHKLCCVGETKNRALELGQNIELTGLRGVINPISIGEFQSDLLRRQHEFGEANHIPQAVRRLSEEDWNSLFNHAEKLDDIFAPLLAFKNHQGLMSVAQIAHALNIALGALTIDSEGNSEFLELEGGRELQLLLEKLVETSNSSFQIECEDIPNVFDALLSGTNTRPRGNTHPRLHIYGPLEMRLLDYDRVILGGLNEGTWPQTVRNDAFINRSMRHELGMASPERRTGLSAHDFQQLMGKKEVILSRASRVDKAPTVMSRWLQRLAALIGDKQQEELKHRGATYLRFAEVLDESTHKSARIERPCPTPPVSSRPDQMAVTDIETWIRDPYAIYAKKILKLQPVAPLEREPDPMLKGTLYHRIMQYYIESNPLKKNVDERLKLLNELAEEVIDEENLTPDISKLWKMRWHEISRPYIEWEESHHQHFKVAASHCELQGEVRLLDGAFKLTARADRIDITQDGSIYLLDYKTGNNPTPPQARTLSPQLALEGLIAKNAGFEAVDETTISDLVYMRLRRGGDFKADSITDKKNSVDSIIENAQNELINLIKGYQFEQQGYVSRRAPFKDGDITGDYDHLARTREWTFGDSEENNG